MFSEGYGNALVSMFLLGVFGALVLALFVPPAVVLGILWLAGPRFGLMVDFGSWYLIGLMVWFVVLAILAVVAKIFG